MLCIDRTKHEGLTLYTSDGPIHIVIARGKSRLEIDAPRSVRILRDELEEEKGEEKGEGEK